MGMAKGLGSGNVFADLGLPDAETRLAKALLIRVIQRYTEEHGLTQRQAAERMGLAQPDVSNMLRGRLTNFSMERLALCLNRLDFDIRIQVASGPRWKKRAAITVEVVGA